MLEVEFENSNDEISFFPNSKQKRTRKQRKVGFVSQRKDEVPQDIVWFKCKKLGHMQIESVTSSKESLNLRRVS